MEDITSELLELIKFLINFIAEWIIGGPTIF